MVVARFRLCAPFKLQLDCVSMSVIAFVNSPPTYSLYTPASFCRPTFKIANDAYAYFYISDIFVIVFRTWVAYFLSHDVKTKLPYIFISLMYSFLVNCLLLKLNRKLRKMFLSPRRESNPQPSDLRWDALTIELPGTTLYVYEPVHIVAFSLPSEPGNLTVRRLCGGSETFFWVCD